MNETLLADRLLLVLPVAGLAQDHFANTRIVAAIWVVTVETLSPWCLLALAPVASLCVTEMDSQIDRSGHKSELNPLLCVLALIGEQYEHWPMVCKCWDCRLYIAGVGSILLDNQFGRRRFSACLRRRVEDDDRRRSTRSVRGHLVPPGR